MPNLFLKNNCLLLGLLSCFTWTSLQAQDDLLNLMDSETPKRSEKVLATFKTTRIVNAHSVETVKAKHLDFRVTHHFGNIASPSGGFHSFYGLDQAADIRIAFEYGITDKLTAGVGRSKVSELVDGYLKYRLLHQTEDNKMPVSLTLFANAAFTGAKANKGPYEDFSNRMSYTYQLLLARKFGSRLSWQIMPALIHRNYVFDAEDENDVFVVGTGARFKITKRLALLADYYFIASQFRMDRADTYFPPLGLGIEIETGGHVFHMFFTNNAAIVENSYFVNTTDSWNKGEVKFGFNISRTFGMGKREVVDSRK